jgi:ParB family chromosome partitioning protein
MVMGGIDCDPASSTTANEIVKASTFYTKDDNGLTRPWRGNIWLNPPYSHPLVSDFADAVVSRYEHGEIRQACVLVNNASETKWFQHLLESCSALCIVKGRIKFMGPKGGTPLQGQSIFYFGNVPLAFTAVFRKFGTVVIDPVRAHLVGTAPGWASNNGQAPYECETLMVELARMDEDKRQDRLNQLYGHRSIFDE